MLHCACILQPSTDDCLYVCRHACKFFTAALNNYPHKLSVLLYLPDSFSLWAAQPEVRLLVSVRLCHEIRCWDSWSKQTEPYWSRWPLLWLKLPPKWQNIICHLGGSLSQSKGKMAKYYFESNRQVYWENPWPFPCAKDTSDSHQCHQLSAENHGHYISTYTRCISM